ncbi:carbon-monoxide dehydrogenase medium subunit [Bacillus sp. SLBN-46]|jgi:aerobic carbon-monoxide dehydrogenase medium subunit|uniref:FAD binding domain-containing protein n=1 Tax=Bacillus sp. SLBN-46 TaxID=3042283 RepID=UPI00285CC238|nr:FAD binding domain-containing protein [Bacillus sp. SLBN-46]MDR6123872.1 carbon-monoxide dehydrogenase medium subunit [Bacillus sp. SLBN-46]
MLPFDFEFYQPETLEEAVHLYQYLDQQGKQPMIYSGGTELITLGRIDMAYTEAVIDIKGIAECNVMQVSGDHLLLGSTLSLTKIEEANLFPLLTKTASEVADHTARGKITLGGNICARIFYREAVLPFLLADSQLFITGPEGKKIVPINDVFQGQLKLNNGEILVQFVTENRFVKAPYFSMKRRQQWETGYPLITVAALKIAEEIRVAVSGLCPFPFRSSEMEETLNNKLYSVEERVERALSSLPNPILDDIEGSAEYRLFVLRHVLMDVLSALDRGNG